METIDRIKELLRLKQDCLTVSTQLVEAGVDIDFPVVFRAFAGAGSMAQAAGRCNREGQLHQAASCVFSLLRSCPHEEFCGWVLSERRRCGGKVVWT